MGSASWSRLEDRQSEAEACQLIIEADSGCYVTLLGGVVRRSVFASVRHNNIDCAN